MKLMYCTVCQPPVVVAAGVIPVAVRRPRINPPPYTYSHSVEGAAHPCKLVAVPDTARAPGEPVGRYLARLGGLYGAYLV